jgi:hypothetical protein
MKCKEGAVKACLVACWPAGKARPRSLQSGVLAVMTVLAECGKASDFRFTIDLISPIATDFSPSK